MALRSGLVSFKKAFRKIQVAEKLLLFSNFCQSCDEGLVEAAVANNKRSSSAANQDTEKQHVIVLLGGLLLAFSICILK